MAALKGEAVDRPPVSVWRHFYDKETSVDGLVEAMLGFQRRWDWDFMKLNPRAQYHVEDWGSTYEYSADPYASPRLVAPAVKAPDDWARIAPLPVGRGVLGEHLDALARVVRELRGEVPVIMTVFTPLSIASRLVESDGVMVSHLREHSEKLHPALEAITETFVAFTRECLARGADGLFFATTSWATRTLITEEEYGRFGRPYDLRVLQAAQEAPFNILHVCRSENMLRLLADYPAQAFNWDARNPTNPSLSEGLGLTGRTVIGGMEQARVHEMGATEAGGQARASLAQAGPRRFMLGPGCTVSPRTGDDQLQAIRVAVKA